MNIRRWFKRHQDKRNTPYSDLKDRAPLSSIDSTGWLTIIAVTGLLVSGVAIAGERDTLGYNGKPTTDVMDEHKDESRHHGRAGGQFDFHDRGLDSKHSRSKDRHHSARQEIRVFKHHAKTAGDIKIKTDDSDNATTKVHKDGTIEHNYRSDDGQIKVNIKVKSDSHTSGNISSRTDIDIDTDSSSSVHIDNKQVNRGNMRHNR